MRGAALPAALILAALCLALAFAPPRIRLPALLAALVAAVAVSQIPLGGDWTEPVYFFCWASLAVTAASVNLPRGVAAAGALTLAGLSGIAAGAVTAMAGGWRDLAPALPIILIAVPAWWLAKSGRGIAVKVVSSWLIAIALLAAALPLTPTPGYEPDHME